MRHTCVRRPSFSVICQARGVGIPLCGMRPLTSTPRSVSQRTHSWGQSFSPTPATSATRMSSEYIDAPNAVCAPPPPSTAIFVVPSAKTKSSTMRVVVNTSMSPVGAHLHAPRRGRASTRFRRPACVEKEVEHECDEVVRVIRRGHESEVSDRHAPHKFKSLASASACPSSLA